jgi:hypothetical protein
MVSTTEKTRQWDRWWVTTLFALASAVFGAGAATMALRKDIEHHCEIDTRQDATIAALQAKVEAIRETFTVKIHTLDTGQAIILEQLREIRATQERMDRNIEKLANGKARELGLEK